MRHSFMCQLCLTNTFLYRWHACDNGWDRHCGPRWEGGVHWPFRYTTLTRLIPLLGTLALVGTPERDFRWLY